MSNTDLIAEIEQTLKKAHTQSFDLSLNEMLDMHLAGELNITPDYQRLFRWSEGQRSRFIESLMLEMPVPPIFVVETEEGFYQLIDGLQRISSYLHFRGKLSAPHLDPVINIGDELRLVDCDIVPALNGLLFNDLPTSLQIRLKRAFIRVEVVRKDSDPKFKYHMFKRLNTGGDKLSDQQIRNATIRMLSDEFPNFLVNLAEYPDFQICTASLTQEKRLSSIDEELVLRFLALKNFRNNFKHEVGDFLTEYMEGVATGVAGFVPEFERAAFEKTFTILARSIAEYAFSFTNKRTGKLTNAFGIYHFEAFTIGIQSVMDKLDPQNGPQMELLSETIKAIKADDTFIQMTTGGGKNSPGPLNERIQFVAQRLSLAFP